MTHTTRRTFLRRRRRRAHAPRAHRRAAARPGRAGLRRPVGPALIDDLVAANRILADQGVVDGYGHVSARHPADPQRYLMSRSHRAGAGDGGRHHGVRPRQQRRSTRAGATSYLERFIHGEIYSARPDVMRGRAQPLALGDPLRRRPAAAAPALSHERLPRRRRARVRHPQGAAGDDRHAGARRRARARRWPRRSARGRWR